MKALPRTGATFACALTLICYVLSVMRPAFYDATVPDGQRPFPGYMCLLWVPFNFVYIEFWANILLFVWLVGCGVMISSSKETRIDTERAVLVLLLSLAALVLSLTFLRHNELPIGVGVDSVPIHLGIGYSLWVAAMAFAVIASSALVLGANWGDAQTDETAE